MNKLFMALVSAAVSRAIIGAVDRLVVEVLLIGARDIMGDMVDMVGPSETSVGSGVVLY